MIFGSQLSALEFLNALPEGKSTKQGLEITYRQLHLGRAGTAIFDMWLGFLQQTSLIGVTDVEVRISDNGIWFLNYLKEQNVSTIKAL